MVGPCGLGGADCCALEVAGSPARAHKLIARRRISFSVEGKQKIYSRETRKHVTPIPAIAKPSPAITVRERTIETAQSNYATDSTSSANAPEMMRLPLFAPVITAAMTLRDVDLSLDDHRAANIGRVNASRSVALYRERARHVANVHVARAVVDLTSPPTFSIKKFAGPSRM